MLEGDTTREGAWHGWHKQFTKICLLPWLIPVTNLFWNGQFILREKLFWFQIDVPPPPQKKKEIIFGGWGLSDSATVHALYDLTWCIYHYLGGWGLNYAEKLGPITIIFLIIKSSFLIRLSRTSMFVNSSLVVQLLQVLVMVAWMMHFLACIAFCISSESDDGIINEGSEYSSWSDEVLEK